MPELKNYKIFISHAWSYSSDYFKLIEFLDKAPFFIYSDYSVPTHDSFGRLNNEQLKEQIKNQIRPVQVVLVLSGIYVSHSNWIDFEIEYARELGKPIVGIQPWGSINTPASVTKYATEIVGWNTSSIVDAIRRNA